MSVFNYKDISFIHHREGSDDYSEFHILSFSYLDYNHQIRSATIRDQRLGSKNIWVATFTGVTTEYTGDLDSVLEEVYKYYQSNSIQAKGDK